MASEVPHIPATAGKLPGCGVDSRSCPMTVSTGLIALWTRLANQLVMDWEIWQVKSSRPQAASAGCAAGVTVRLSGTSGSRR